MITKNHIIYIYTPMIMIWVLTLHKRIYTDICICIYIYTWIFNKVFKIPLAMGPGRLGFSKGIFHPPKNKNRNQSNFNRNIHSSKLT